MALRSGENVLFSGHPSWRSMLAFHLRGLVAAVAAGVAAGLLSAAAHGSVEVLWVVVAVVAAAAAALAVAALRRRRLTYTITSERLTIEVGILSRELHETRLERVQNVTARQSLLERALGIGTVDFDTAGGAEYSFSFAGVDDPRAIVRVVHDALGDHPGLQAGS